MNILSGFILLFSVVQLLVALVNLLFMKSWANLPSSFNGLVSILIPARNEEKNIGHLLADLLKQSYRNIEIIVFNDLSTDRTSGIVDQYALQDGRIRLINSEGLPEGWLGKNYACHNLSQFAKGDLLLFLDADVRISKSIIADTAGRISEQKLGLLSIFPVQIMSSFGERCSVPVMNYILLSLLPLILVRKTNFPSLAAANGQYMFFNADIYRATLPHLRMRLNKVEDIGIARWYKRENIRVSCITGNDSIRCRMYNNYREAVNGFSKNIVNFFGNSFILTILFWIITTFGFMAVYFSFSKPIFFLYLLVVILTRIIISVISHQRVFDNLLLLVPQQLVMGHIFILAIINKTRKKFEWKGRNIS
jgi:glycosyltransferase involved in cell wall biosynthesis